MSGERDGRGRSDPSSCRLHGRGSASPAPAPPARRNLTALLSEIRYFEIRMEWLETRNIDGSSFELSADFWLCGIIYLYMTVKPALMLAPPQLIVRNSSHFTLSTHNSKPELSDHSTFKVIVSSFEVLGRVLNSQHCLIVAEKIRTCS